VICVPPYMHPEMAIAALAHGIHARSRSRHVHIGPVRKHQRVRLANSIHLTGWTGHDVPLDFGDDLYLSGLNERIR
jgi:hypothetical protein